jgi:hypothetical protein
MGGSVPDFAMKWAIKSSLSVVKRLQYKYVRNGKDVDAEMRLARRKPPRLDQLSEDQKEIVDRCRALEVGSGLRRWTALEATSNLVQMWVLRTHPTGNEATR